MYKVLTINHLRKNSASYFLDILALLCVYFIPTFSHLTGVPFYLFEPMRIFIVLALIHSNRINAYILALTLPIFSFAIASHPVLIKSMIISVELVINVFVYFFLVHKKLKSYLSLVISVIISKSVYYLFKFLLIQFFFLQSELVSTPLFIQLLTTGAFCLYALIISNIRQRKVYLN